MRAVDTAIGRGDRDRGRKLRQDLMQTIKSSPSVFVDKFRINLLKKEALTSGANKAVLAEVQKNTGGVKLQI